MPFTVKLQSPNYDRRVVYDGSISAGSNLFTSPTAGFTAGDVGLDIDIFGAATDGGHFRINIASVLGPTQCTVGVAAGRTVTNAFTRIGNNGFEIHLPCYQDEYSGDSLAAILPLFDGENKLMDFRQYREVVRFAGFLTQSAAEAAGFANPIEMRDEMRRIRGEAANSGLNLNSSRSWLNEGGAIPFSSSDWGTVTLSADERDASTPRQEATCRLVWDYGWDPSTRTLRRIFMYGTVQSVQFGPRLAATLRTRIPFSLTFLAGTVQVGS